MGASTPYIFALFVKLAKLFAFTWSIPLSPQNNNEIRIRKTSSCQMVSPSNVITASLQDLDVTQV